MRYIPVKTALTPEQKGLKKDWLLEQQRAGDKVPALWEMYAHHEPEDAAVLGFVRPEDVIRRFDWELIEEHFGETDASLGLVFEDIDDPEDPFAYIRKEEAVLEEYREALLEKLSDADLAPYREQIAQQRVPSKFLSWYEEATGLLETLPGQTCYRAVLLPRSVDPTQHAGLGVYWSYDQWGAKAYWSGDKHANEAYRIVRYEARIDADNIDRVGTVTALTTRIFRVNNESEVRFYRHAPIFVYGVHIHDGTNRYDDPSEFVEINDWRRT